jgi:hypothetical protein
MESKSSIRSMTSNGSRKRRSTKKVISYSAKAIANCVLLSTGVFLSVCLNEVNYVHVISKLTNTLVSFSWHFWVYQFKLIDFSKVTHRQFIPNQLHIHKHRHPRSSHYHR